MAGPRYSIIPGDFALDQRADVSHFRVLNLIGRHTDQAGWCRLKQLTIGEQVGLTRETVNRKLRELVEWGYVEKRAHDATGRAIWYRTIMDRGAPPAGQVADDDDLDDLRAAHGSKGTGGHVRDGSHVGYNQARTCDRSDHTRCDRKRSHYNDPSLTTEETPTPQAGESSVDEFCDDEVLTARVKSRKALDAMRPGPVVDKLLRPIVTQRRFSATDHGAALEAIASRAKGMPTPLLEKAAELVLGADVSVIKLDRVLAALEAVRRAGLMLVISRKANPKQWAAWERHYSAENPKIAPVMARADKWQVPRAWPDSSQSEDAA